MAAIRSSALFLAALALAACDAPPEPAPSEFLPRTSEPHCEQRTFESTLFTACRYDGALHRIEMAVDCEQGPLRSFSKLEQHLGSRAEDLLFAMNAGMYDEAGMPIGLYVEDGEERRPINLREGPGNFHMRPNGSSPWMLRARYQSRRANGIAEARRRRSSPPNPGRCC